MGIGPVGTALAGASGCHHRLIVNSYEMVLFLFGFSFGISAPVNVPLSPLVP
jgi:hypothetical protein